jgi:predicted anti-sigma-YlaC factor YlaD
MAAVEIFPSEYDVTEVLGTTLRVVPKDFGVPQYRRGPLVANRRAARARMKRRRRRSALAALVLISLVLLAWPGHAFGGTNGVGLSTDLASSSTLSSGMEYVVQPGDSLETIAHLVNPVNPSLALRALTAELHSNVVIAGEHVLIP